MDEASGDGFDSFRNNFQEEGRDKTENSEDESGLNEKLVARPINNYRSLLDSDSDEDEVKSEVPGPKRQVLTSSDSENSRNSNGSIKVNNPYFKTQTST